MKTYIRKNINGYYIDFPEEIDVEYWKGKIGSTYEDFLDNKWVLLSDELTAFHAEHPEATISQVLAMVISNNTVHERTLEDAKNSKLAEIEMYDESSDVNGFDVLKGGQFICTTWFTPTERANYRSSIDAAELIGLTELSLYINETKITLPIQTAKLMLAQIQLYADECFIVTKQHKAAVEALTNIEDVDAYNNETNYPQKLSFVID